MAYSLDQLRQSNIIDPTFAEAVKSQPVPVEKPTDYPTRREIRASHLRKLRHLMPVPGPIPDQIQERELFITARDGYQIRTIHYSPNPPTTPSKSPLIILYHEGGWTTGDHTDEEFNARLLVQRFNAVVLNVEYRLAPEHPFPTGVLDAWDVLQYAAKHATSPIINANPRSHGFIVGGSSAGGNLSAIMTHLATKSSSSPQPLLDPPLTGQWLSVPYLIPSTEIPAQYSERFISPRENHLDPVITSSVLEWESTTLTNTLKVDVISPLFSVVAEGNYPPSNASSSNSTSSANGGETTPNKLPKAFIQVAGLDPLRDHGIIYNQILKEEYGVETKLKVYDGVGHMFWTNWPELEISKRWSRDLVDGMAWLLGV